MNQKKSSRHFTLSAIALGVAATLRSGEIFAQAPPGWSKDDPVTNPVTGDTEYVSAVLDNPAYSVRTDKANIIWVGPTVKDATFDLTYRAAEPAQNGAPAIPERPAGTYKITDVAKNAAGRVTSVTYQLTGQNPPPAVTFNTVKALGKVPPIGSAGAGAGNVDPPPPGNRVDDGEWIDRTHGDYGSNGADGWGVEICIIDCWTIGDDADPGGPGSAGQLREYTLVLPDITMRSDDRHGIWISSRGGDGGQGGDAYGILDAAMGGTAGQGGRVNITTDTNVETHGTGSYGIFIQSRAGAAGDGGSGYGISDPGTGGAPAEGGDATLVNFGDVETFGTGSIGLYVQSLGGGGGSSGDSFGIVGEGGDGSEGGNGARAEVTNHGNLVTHGTVAAGIFAQSIGGQGGDAGTVGGIASLGGNGASGGDGRAVSVTNDGSITTFGDFSHGIVGQSVGGGGGNGSDAGGISSVGGTGSSGGKGGTVIVDNDWVSGTDFGSIETWGLASHGILAESIGGGGGNGGSAGGVAGIGGGGTSGGQGDTVTVKNDGLISTHGRFSEGILAHSIGGGGGAGGNGDGLVGIGGSSSGDPDKPSNGGEVFVSNEVHGVIHTYGRDATAIHAQSIGGGGGAGAGAGGVGAIGGSGSGGGNGNHVKVDNDGQLITEERDSSGIIAQSIGGGGGSASNSGGGVEIGGTGGGGGNGAFVEVYNRGLISTQGIGSDGIYAQSVGGGGGNGASSDGPVAIGGSGSGGGNGGRVLVDNSGVIATQGTWAHGIMAESIGGGGGKGGDGDGLVSVGGEGGPGGAAATPDTADRVDVLNSGSIATLGNQASAIEARSVGGGGGVGGSTGGAFVTIGGRGGDGGKGGEVHIDNDRSLSTGGDDSHGIFAQSVGGGGGNGGSSTSLSVFAGAAVGGDGGNASDGDLVIISGGLDQDDLPLPDMPVIETHGDRSKGVFAQSVGGGGGNGGFAVQATGGYGIGTSAAIGGTGGAGGNGGQVSIEAHQSILTSGQDADGIVAQSIGGGGGNGGFAVSFAAGLGDVGAGAISATVGGRGGKGGTGGLVSLNAGGNIQTTGDQSDGIVAQSVGGGGGNGGFAISVAVSGAGGGAGAVAAAIGGTGGDGGLAGPVTVQYTGDITTSGDDSTGVISQAVGGGGGNGGYTVAGTVSGAGGAAGAASVGVGGSGGKAGNGGVVSTSLTGNLTTTGDRSTGLVSQSIGGRGGNGGFNVSGSIAGAGAAGAAVAVGIGGAGGDGGSGDSAAATLIGDATTLGTDADAVLVQSVGGGGGNGGFNVSGTISGGGTAAGAVSVGVGGAGGGAGDGMGASGMVTGNLATAGNGSNGLVVQSIGGGGGNGGFNVSGAITGAGSGAAGVSVGVGGAGGDGGAGGIVYAEVHGSTHTQGDNATGIVAQSLGGGGGNGGFDVSASIAGSGSTAGAISVGVGGSGGKGGASNLTTLAVVGDTRTEGDNSGGILAQSVAGGGGSGGFSVADSISGSGSTSAAVSVGIGGSGGDGGSVLAMTWANVQGNVVTRGVNSAGITSQSIGGGGGSGGFTVGGSISGSGGTSGAVSVGLGGSGGKGGSAAEAAVTLRGDLETFGLNSDGVLVQSIGGGGGNGGFSVVGSISGAGSDSGAVSVGLGGSGAGAGNGGLATANVTGMLITHGDNSSALIAQSIGGGGGSGGFAVAADVSGAGQGAGGVAVGLGGSGGGGGNGGVVNALVRSDAGTLGDNSTAVVVQSLGGGGGVGGMSVAGSVAGSGQGAGAVSVGIGGAGGEGGHSDLTTLNMVGGATTLGDDSGGVLVQSVGGGGGAGGMSVVASLAGSGKGAGAVAVGLGGSGGKGGDGAEVRSTVSGLIGTQGDRSIGYVAQSLGGGGGAGGMNVSGTVSASGTETGSVAVGVGGSGGGGGDGFGVTAGYSGQLTTGGDDSLGLLFQSVGGGGGAGGMNVTGAVSASNSGAGSVAVGIGGAGGDGGDAGNVIGNVGAQLLTTGDRSIGVLMQSVGGGGGSGGLNASAGIALSKGAGGALAVGVGGFGGGGGVGRDVTGTVDGSIETRGAGSTGVLAQSVGGGGGTGGMNVTGAVSLTKSSGGSAALGVGGFGGDGGAGGAVVLERAGTTLTSGANSDGIVAQSIGGGGGNGGMNISGAIAATQDSTVFTAALGLGGFGGGAGDAGEVHANIQGDVLATGYSDYGWIVEDGQARPYIDGGSNGVLVQSVGGAGGNGGMNVSGGIALASSTQGHSYGLNLGVGGFAGGGGNAGEVTLNLDGRFVQSFGDRRFGVAAQSIGGGGGTGGVNVSGGIVMDGSITGGVGGFGGDGGYASDVDATVNSNIVVVGQESIGFLAQSVGGGGGSGGLNVSGGIQASRQAETPSLVFGIGGFGGNGNISGDVHATQNGLIQAQGANSIGVLAQSVAGGGGNGALNVSGNIARGKGYGGSLGVGGSGGSGADAGDVLLVSDGHISVDGTAMPLAPDDPDYDPSAFDIAQAGYRDRANGILAQSIGGGGGNGGMNVSGMLSPDGNPITVGIGGTGSGGGHGGAVTVRRGENAASDLYTYGNNANGLTAQSIGGGGGNAGMNFLFSNSGGASEEENKKKTAVMLGVGGSGGDPGNGDVVDVRNDGDISTSGNNSFGLLAQSVGGGGGNATFNIGLGNNPDAKAFNVAIGGAVGDGGSGGDVSVDNRGDIVTAGDVSSAIMAQSVGGGGGNTGMDMVTSPRSASGVDIGLGRFGGNGGRAHDVFVSSSGELRTFGDRSLGIRAQSVGNGGGDGSSSSIEFSGEGEGQAGGDEQKGQDWSASLEVGLDGGLGGIAGNVEVHAAGSIMTQGLASHGIHAQSVGGGGGNGGALERHGIMEAANQRSIGIGGSGGEGAISGDVSVDNDATIVTIGDDSHGVFAQSIGGGGGTGGYIAQIDLETGGGTGGSVYSMQMGGSGGEGAESGRVDVVNTGSIATAGRKSFGIDAVSLGGGGGEAGAIISTGITRGDTTRNVSVNLGGDGGEGANSKDVTVLNQGSVWTTGEESTGIRAQSLGGKGGDAGVMLELGAIALTSDQKANNLAVKVGGDGGTGGTGGNVEVTNIRVGDDPASGVIHTEGRGAHGIFAQSIGGGGGNGSSIVTSNLGASARGQATLVNLSVGGDGGTGGTAGDVTVSNQSSIYTAGLEAHGVFAQSIGGGGGNGGLAIAANAVLAKGDVANEGLVTLGGSGGSGDDAGDVLVENSGTIVTQGTRSQGIFAQSIGGGGGNAGIGFGASTNPGSMLIAGTLSAAFGGEGGHGGQGGHVTVNHSGDISVFGESSQAMVAESINGGGGHIALDFNGVSTLPGVPSEIFNGIPLPNGSGGAPVIVFDGGGHQQQNSDAGRVTINNTGTFGVAGRNGAANAVQAVGGGGGTFDLNLALDDVAGTADDVQIQGRLGGVEGTNNRGGDIDSAHEGDLVTTGDNTPGALMQSIGGGGGRANLNLASEFGSIGDTDLTLGGEDGSNEKGGDIAHAQNGSVATSGASAHGGVFQSVGGGGGSLSLLVDGGTAAAAGSEKRLPSRKTGGGSAQQVAPVSAPHLAFGSSGGSLLEGGNVTLDLDGNIETTGDNAVGMIFQSVGAGGGVANVRGVQSLDVTLGGSNGASGDGGDLVVDNTGDVATRGARSHGVFLQSVGGGGSALFTDAADVSVNTSADNVGNGGDIEFVQTGTIATRGAHAYSVFAQSVGGGGGYVDGGSSDGPWAGSAGGTGTAGTISLDLNGDIAAMGEHATGLFAQSTGADGLGGDITATLAAQKQLIGGVEGVAVYFDGGAANRFTNYGAILTRSGPLGFAFRGGAGGDFVDNHGTMMGNIDLGTGVNGFANNVGATLYSGTTINLGDRTNVLRNDGLLSPGANRLAVHTQLSGSYLQSATGAADMEMDFTTKVADRIIASGTAEVGGVLNVTLLNTHQIRSGTTWQPFFTARGGVTNRGLALNGQQSIVIDYALYQDPDDLGVAYDVDFAAHGRLEGNRAEMGEYLNRVQRLGQATGVGDVVTAAVLETDIDDYAFMLTQLDTEFYAEQQALALTGVQRFARNLQNCGTLSIGETAGDATGCVWGRYDDNPSSRESAVGFPDSRDDGYSLSTGWQKPLEGDWTLGAAFDFEDHHSRGFDNRWTATSQFFQVGASLRREFGAGTLGATLQIGNNQQDVTRRLGVTANYESQGDRDVYFFSNVLDYTWNLSQGGFSFQPSLNLGTSLLRFGGTTEQGAGGQSATIAGGTETHLWAEPALGARYVATFASGSSLRSFARVGLLQYLSGTSTKVRAGLAGAPAGTEPMRIGSDLDRTHWVGEAGLQYEMSGGFTLGLSYTQQQSELREGGAGSLRFVMPLK